MADFLVQALGEITDIVNKAAIDMFGGGTGADAHVDGIRWEGMTNAQLASAVQLLGQGPGAAVMTQAADALAAIAADLHTIDQTLHDQLQAIGINWQSQASDLAQEMTTASAAYGGSAGQAAGQSSASVGHQGDAYSIAKNTVPHPNTLNGPTGTNIMSGLYQGITGHETDAAKQVAKTNAARQVAVDTMNNYTTASQSAVNSYQPLPQPPGVGLQTQQVNPSLGQITSVSGFTGAPAGIPGASGPAGSYVAMPGGVQGAPGFTPGPAFGGGPGGSMAGPVSGVGPGLPGMPAPIAPGLPVGPGVPGMPGPISGVGPVIPPAAGTPIPVEQAAGANLSAIIEDAAVGTAILGGTAGAGIAAGKARPEQLVRSRDLAAQGQAEGAPPEGIRQEATQAIVNLEGEEAAAAQVNERIGATATPPPSMMEPAVAGRRGEDDEEHITRYAVESDEMFGDARMVVPPVLGLGGDGDHAADPK
jgi:hypothetical protein